MKPRLHSTASITCSHNKHNDERHTRHTDTDKLHIFGACHKKHAHNNTENNDGRTQVAVCDHAQKRDHNGNHFDQAGKLPQLLAGLLDQHCQKDNHRKLGDLGRLEGNRSQLNPTGLSVG